MKKVYLLTFHGSVNYGAVLQAYALFRSLQNVECECEVIDYNRNMHHKNFLRIKWDSNIKSVLYQCLQYPSKYILHRKFDDFTRKNMKLTKQSYDGVMALDKAILEKDAVYMVGSDQVWNCELTENNMHYYLDFVESDRKYSYAASFGITDIEKWEKKEECILLLKQFCNISVREESGQDIIENYLKKDAKVVCDPTFLLTAVQWEQMAIVPKRKDYIVLFLLTRDETLIQAAKETGKEYGLEIINIAYSVKKIQGVKDIKGIGPEQWLGYIKKASFVFTNSFHGFALSLNFEKQVWVGLSHGNRNSRIVDMAERYGVTERIVKENFSKNPIVYSEIRRKICKDKEYSQRFLEDIINGTEE